MRLTLTLEAACVLEDGDPLLCERAVGGTQHRTEAVVAGAEADRGEGGGLSLRHDRNSPLHKKTAMPPITWATAKAAAAPKWCAWQSSS